MAARSVGYESKVPRLGYEAQINQLKSKISETVYMLVSIGDIKLPNSTIIRNNDNDDIQEIINNLGHKLSYICELNTGLKAKDSSNKSNEICALNDDAARKEDTGKAEIAYSVEDWLFIPSFSKSFKKIDPSACKIWKSSWYRDNQKKLNCPIKNGVALYKEVLDTSLLQALEQYDYNNKGKMRFLSYLWLLARQKQHTALDKALKHNKLDKSTDSLEETEWLVDDEAAKRALPFTETKDYSFEQFDYDIRMANLWFLTQSQDWVYSAAKIRSKKGNAITELRKLGASQKTISSDYQTLPPTQRKSYLRWSSFYTFDYVSLLRTEVVEDANMKEHFYIEDKRRDEKEILSACLKRTQITSTIFGSDMRSINKNFVYRLDDLTLSEIYSRPPEDEDWSFKYILLQPITEYEACELQQNKKHKVMMKIHKFSSKQYYYEPHNAYSEVKAEIEKYLKDTFKVNPNIFGKFADLNETKHWEKLLDIVEEKKQSTKKSKD